MKTYPVTDLTGDKYLNPGTPYGDGTGTHQRNVNQITSISIHHDASVRPHDYDSVARYRSEAAAHYNRLGPGLQYHYKIDNVGEIFQIRPLTTWLYCVGSAENVSTIAICLDGYFHAPHNQEPTREQYEALFQLLTYLCTQRPDFSATWKDVRPHADFSSTACAGSVLNPSIYPIQDEATARASLLNKGTYDWPELQPVSPTVPTPPPVVTPPTPPTTTINYRVKLDDKQIGAYTVDTNAWNKYKSVSGSLIFDQNGNDVTQQLKAKFEPAPPQADPNNNDHALADRVSALEKIVNLILGYLRKWKRFNKYEGEQK